MEVHRDGASYLIVLTHGEVQSIAAGGDVLSAVIPEIAPVIQAAADVLVTIDLIGGNNGVEVSGVIGSAQLMVLPKTSGIWGTLIHTAQEIGTLYLKLTNPALFLASIGISFLGHTFGSSNGEVHCDEDQAKSEETFVLVTNSNGLVSLLSFNGYFTADSDDRLIYANRSQALRDEQFRLISNSDGTVSFQSWMRTYMCADRNRGGKRVSVDRTAIGDWEKWKLVFLGGGKVALRESEGKFASVAP